jgi:hypothetical protein
MTRFTKLFAGGTLLLCLLAPALSHANTPIGVYTPEQKIALIQQLIAQLTALQAQLEALIKQQGTTPPTSSGSITVTAPNGGEVWDEGVLNSVTWSPYNYNPDVNPSNDVTAYLEKSNGFGGFTVVGQLYEEGKASIHTYFHLQNQTGYPAPGQYYVRVVNNRTGASDRSDAAFTLQTPPVDLKVNGSDGPLTLPDNTLVQVTWNTKNVTQCILQNIRTFSGGPITTEYLILPFGSKNFYTSSNGYLYVDCLRTDGTHASDWVSLTTTPSQTNSSLQVLSPNGGDRLSLGAQYTIRWKQVGLSRVSIALYKNDQWQSWIVRSLSSDKSYDDTYSYTWTTPTTVDLSSQAYKIYITGDKADASGYLDDKSDGSFNFASNTSGTPSCTLTATPSIVAPGAPVTLSWTTSNAGTFALVSPWDNPSVGSNPARGGSTTVYPTRDITYTASVASVTGQQASCTASIQMGDTSTNQTGTYQGYLNGSLFITTQNITQANALTNCKLNATSNPTSSIRCTWNGSDIYSSAGTAASASIDSSSLQAATYTPTITGTASGVTNVGISIGDNGGKAFGSGTVPVVNGRWSVSVWPALVPQSNPYTVYVYGSNSTVLATGNLTVTPPSSKPSCSMSVNPTVVTPNSGTLLTWSTTNASSFTLTNFQGTFTAPLSGSSTITPSQDIVYTGNATGPGGTASCSVTARVSTQSASAYAAIAAALNALQEQIKNLKH